MSVVGTATERPDSPTGNFTLNKHSITRKFTVQTNSYADGILVVTAAPGIPKMFSLYQFGNEGHRYARVREISGERVDPNSLYWTVEVKYETPDTKEASNKSESTQREKEGQADNPLIQLPEIEFAFEQYQEVVWWVYDLKNQKITPCRNSAGQVFDPPPTRDAARLTMTITRNEDITAPHPALAIQYQDTTNISPWWGAAPNQVKCMSITVKRETKQLSNGNIFPYLRASYKFQFRFSWLTQLLDAGTYYLNDAGGIPPKIQKLKFLSDDGHPITGPLDGFGNKLEEGANPVFLPFQFYRLTEFNALGLPQSMLDFS